MCHKFVIGPLVVIQYVWNDIKTDTDKGNPIHILTRLEDSQSVTAAEQKPKIR